MYTIFSFTELFRVNIDEEKIIIIIELSFLTFFETFNVGMYIYFD